MFISKRRYGAMTRMAIFSVLIGFMGITANYADADEIRPVKTSPVKSVELDTMTVTAQKQEENVQDVPVSITVIGEQDIEDKNIQSVADIADFVPGLMIFSNGASAMNSPSMRGIHAFVESLTVSSGLFVDGVPILSATGFEDALLDIERVEILRGPQGTLYGKNTETGAINIITRQPDNTVRGKASVELGEDEKRQISFNVSGPIKKDNLFIGLAGQYYEKEGFIDNTITGESANDREHWYGKGQLRWTPADNLDVSLIASRLQYDDGGHNMGLAEKGAAAYGLPAPEDRKVSSNFPGKNESRSTAQSIKITYDIDDALALTSITTRRVFDDIASVDWDFSPLTLMHVDKDSQYSKASQELRLDSSAGKVKWLVGLYYDTDHNDVNTFMKSDIPGRTSTNDRDFYGDAYSVFGQASCPVMQRLSLIGGLRYEKQEMEFEDHVAGTRRDHSWDEISPKLALEYTLSPEAMAYASVSKGYRSGGFNTYATNPQYAKYDEEKLWSYEIGAKSKLLDNRLILNGAVYYMDIDDMQVNESITPYEAYLTNAGKASAIGGEVEMTAMVAEGLTLMAGAGYCDIEFDEFKDAMGDYKNNKNPYAPAYTFNIGAQYRDPGGFYARADLIGYGKMYFDKANEYARDAYEIVNAKIGYEREQFDLYLYGSNLFDKEYNSYGFFDGFYTIYSEPREVGVKIEYRF